jgi:hypothetical protein
MWSLVPRDSALIMIALARTNSNCKRQTHPLVKRGYYIRTITENVQLKNKITGRESQGACRQDELIGGKPTVVKWLWLWMGFLRIFQFPLPILIPPTVPYSLITISTTLHSLDTDSVVKHGMNWEGVVVAYIWYSVGNKTKKENS